MTQTPDIRRPFSWQRFLRNVVFIVLAIAVYAYGWKVTRIDLKTLITDAGDIKPLVLDLLRPELFTREKQSIRLAVEYPVPCPPEFTPKPATYKGTVLEVKPACGPSNKVRLILRNGRPNTKALVRWHFPIGSDVVVAQARTDDQGNLDLVIARPKPDIGGDEGIHAAEVILEWEEGPVKISNTLRTVADKMVETIFLALMATTFGVIFALPVSFFGARNLMMTTPWGAVTYYVVRLVFNVLRSVETLIWAVIFIVWVGIGPFAGVLALTIHSIAALAKLYSEAIESIDPGPIEAITATGATRLQTIIYAVVPQVIPPFIAFTIYRWDINVRMSTVVGLVGGGGIGYILIQYINLLQYRKAAVAMWAIVIVVSLMDYLSGYVREKIV
ncbi:MAG: phosphonate ABC transporter, permease protein PhnE [Chloroflexi bacterium]|nr:phosphonate ABC transporter, permease protein PhnE [Chloroflexota bacterium]